MIGKGGIKKRKVKVSLKTSRFGKEDIWSDEFMEKIAKRAGMRHSVYHGRKKRNKKGRK